MTAAVSPPSPERSLPNRGVAVALVAIMAVGLVLRLLTLGSHLTGDEGYSYLVGSAPSAGAFLQRLAAYENTPPLFYLLLSALPLDHAYWLRLPAMIPGALTPLVLYLALRRPLGVRTALLAAAIVAVAPFHVSYSDFARGFMLEGLACMLALWAMLRLLGGARARWWLLYLAAGGLALYSEYDAAIFLVALTVGTVALGQRDRIRTGVLGLLPLAFLLPWTGQIERGQDALGYTKLLPGAGPGSLRDAIVRVALGEHGAAASVAVRWLQFLLLAATLAMALVVLGRRAAGVRRAHASRVVLVIATTAALVLIGHALVHIFNEHYLTVLIPLGAAVVAAAVAQAGSRWLWIGATVAVAAVAVAVLAQRYRRQYEPDLAPIRAAVAAVHPRTVLTNSAVVAYYLRRLHPVVDRPDGLGPGLDRSCKRLCVVVDDSRVPGGVRPGPGVSQTIGFFTIRLAAGPGD